MQEFSPCRGTTACRSVVVARVAVFPGTSLLCSGSVSYLRLDGSVEASKRFDIVKKFNADPTIDVLLLTTHGQSCVAALCTA